MVLPSLILCLAHAGIYRLNWSSSGLEIAKKYDLKWPRFLMKLPIVFLAGSNVLLRSRLRRNSLPLSIFLRNKSKHHNLHFFVSLNLSLFNKWRLEYVHHREIAICIWNRIQMLKVCKKGPSTSWISLSLRNPLTAQNHCLPWKYAANSGQKC